MADRSVGSISRALTERPEIDIGKTPDWLDSLAALPDTLEAVEKRKWTNYSRDTQLVAQFESNIANKLENAIGSQKIYNEEEIPEIKQSITNYANTMKGRFPHLISEIDDEMLASLGKINIYSEKNKNRNLLIEQIAPTQGALQEIVNTLAEKPTSDFTPEDRIDFRRKVFDSIEQVNKYDRILADEYHAGMKGWDQIYENVSLGISGASKELITQIMTWDDGDYILGAQDKEAINRGLLSNDLADIKSINASIEKDKTSRTKNFVKDYTNYLENYNAAWKIAGNPEYQKMKKLKEDEATKIIEGGGTVSPDHWFAYPTVTVEGMPEEGVNVQNIDAQLIQIKDKAEDIDAKFRSEHIQGRSIAEILNKPLPWKLREKQKRDKLITDKTDYSGESMTQEEYETYQALQADPEGEGVERFNPGNLKFRDQKDSTGKDEQGFAIFPSEEAGWQALYSQIDKDKGRNLTLKNFINKYAPPVENDTTAYLKNVQKWLNVGKNKKIKKIDTKKLANAIARQEGWGGSFPSIDPPPEQKPKVKFMQADKQLTKVVDNKRIVNYDTANKSSFDQQQKNLKKMASSNFKSLSKDDKKIHGNAKNYIKNKYNEWLNVTGKKGKYPEGVPKWEESWYHEEDFIYFYPTKTDSSNTVINPTSGWKYRLYHPSAFSGTEGVSIGKFGKKGIVRPNIRPKIKDGAYEQFAKDFDDFRKFLQES